MCPGVGIATRSETIGTGPDATTCGTPTGSAVVVAPIGFVSDHMEVKFDLDTQAAEAARELGMTMVRAGTVGTHPAFVSGLVDLIERHAAGNGAVCPPDCCPAPARGRPAPVSPAPS